MPENFQSTIHTRVLWRIIYYADEGRYNADGVGVVRVQ